MEGQTSPDQIIHDIGGCGRYQIRMSVIVHVMKTIVCFTIMSMIIMSATPPWWCEDKNALLMNNITSCKQIENGSEVTVCPAKSCYGVNTTKCSSFAFGSRMKTIVSEFNLVCERDYIPSTIMTLQLAGVLAGNVLAGQTADLIGRKPPFFASIVLITLANLVGFLSVNWIMFGVARLFVGMGAGFFLTTQYSLLSEFSLSKWRVWIIGFPSWPIEQCVLALCAWLIQDWRYLQLMIAIMGVPCLFAWFVIPESFRWYIAHDKPEKARAIIEKVAVYNGRPDFDVSEHLVKPEGKSDRKYTFIDLFRSKKLIKISVLSSFNWVGLGLISYGISYGVQSLSGNLYLNFFLFALTGIPSKAIALWLQNKFGRRSTSILCYTIVAISGFVVGIVQTIDAPNKDSLTNGFALLAHTGIATAWGPVQTMTIELYPTVIRNIAFGSLSVTGRIGAMVGPQLVYLNAHVPGLLYYACAAASVLCVIGSFGLPETMDANLSDKIGEKRGHLIKENGSQVV
ncbi:solute carrier family 22 member 4-like isoform X2 [Mercenaria mercenaria]|nr:solute carrier family 22 member 4-like isoform X2 [Mercenaria mercenaria]XP_053393424.1 solute carrier family 22 member 4-like isoform X2 [Mercenaria mercenaria]XP_053393425.1 solute carrier family 22 member 4-like isoform X2 [Mercenaria mercenaria]